MMSHNRGRGAAPTCRLWVAPNPSALYPALNGSLGWTRRQPGAACVPRPSPLRSFWLGVLHRPTTSHLRFLVGLAGRIRTGDLLTPGNAELVR
jgi:hypothetical protein